MHTYLIISKTNQTRDSHALQMAKELNIHDLDLIVLEKEGSIGIEDVRNFQKQLMLKPFKSTQKAAIIKYAQNLTIEAQNALLKTLEEPPNNTLIFLTAEPQHSLLPTILSRTSIVILDDKESIKDTEQISDQLDALFSDAINTKLKLAQDLSANKDTALQWLEAAIAILRNQMLEQEENAATYIITLELFQETYVTIKTTNVNVRFALEILFLKCECIRMITANKC